MTDPRYFFENAYVEAVREGDYVLADPVYGAERVTAIEEHDMGRTGIRVRKLTLDRPTRGEDSGGIRFVVRMTREEIVRILLVDRPELTRLQAKGEELALR